jgi:UPF0755 protein
MKNLKFIINAIVLCLIAAIVGLIYCYYVAHPEADFGKETKYLLVKKGETVEKIAENLFSMGAIDSKSNFVFFARMTRRDALLKVGRYAIKPQSSLSYLIGIMSRGESTPFNVTIPEGYTMAQISNLLESTAEISSPDFRDVVTDRKYIDSLRIAGDNLEGYLAPCTYNLYYAENPRRVVHRMISHFYDSLPDSFEIKASHLGLTFHQAVTLASIIEKEAMIDSERPIISAVYLNRLRRGMRLDCDPTVIYALGGLKRPLMRDDLEVESPYNTYRNIGLPPGPIANPGTKSLTAAVNPAPVGFLYFVAKGDGSHAFSYSLDDHNTATARIKRQNGR